MLNIMINEKDGELGRVTMTGTRHELLAESAKAIGMIYSSFLQADEALANTFNDMLHDEDFIDKIIKYGECECTTKKMTRKTEQQVSDKVDALRKILDDILRDAGEGENNE